MPYFVMLKNAPHAFQKMMADVIIPKDVLTLVEKEHLPVMVLGEDHTENAKIMTECFSRFSTITSRSSPHDHE